MIYSHFSFEGEQSDYKLTTNCIQLENYIWIRSFILLYYYLIAVLFIHFYQVIVALFFNCLWLPNWEVITAASLLSGLKWKTPLETKWFSFVCLWPHFTQLLGNVHLHLIISVSLDVKWWFIIGWWLLPKVLH